MANTMKAALLKGWNDLAVEDVPMPEVGAGEVLVRVNACGLCGTDLKMVEGAFESRGWPPSLPFIIGHEWSGEVVEIGPDLDPNDLGYGVGTRVVAENHAGCGQCFMCRTGSYNLCERVKKPGYKLYGHTAPGALAEFAVRPSATLHPIPETVSDLAGALVNQGALTVHALRRVQFRAGGTAVIYGPGLLGLMEAAVARAAGATQVIVVGRGHRLDLAKQMGASDVVDYSQGDPVEGVLALTNGRGADYAFDCTGTPSVIPQALNSVRRGGKVAVLGLAGHKEGSISPDKLVLDEIDLLGIRSSPGAYPAMIALMATGAVDPSPIITHVYGIDEVDKAFEALKTREAIRPIVKL